MITGSDPTIDALDKLIKFIEGARSQLDGMKCITICNSDGLSIHEVFVARKQLVEFGYKLGPIVMNRILPVRERNCDYCVTRYDREQEAIIKIRRHKPIIINEILDGFELIVNQVIDLLLPRLLSQQVELVHQTQPNETE